MNQDRVAQRVRRETVARGPSADRKSGHPDTFLVSYGEMAYSDEWGYWRGTMSGDASGKAEFRESPKNFEKDGIEYYFETFVLKAHDGVLRGTKNGVYDLTTGDFWDHGHVAEASGRWSHLTGYLVFERDRTTTPGIFPMRGYHTPLVLVPPHPTPGLDDRALISCADTVFSDRGRSWTGRLAGDIRGKAEFQAEQSYAIGDMEYFSGTLTVTTREGTFLGTDAGVRDRTTGDFWACGYVTEASGSWDLLVGHMLIEWGRRTGPPGQPVQAHRTPFVLVRVRED